MGGCVATEEQLACRERREDTFQILYLVPHVYTAHILHPNVRVNRSNSNVTEKLVKVHGCSIALREDFL